MKKDGIGTLLLLSLFVFQIQQILLDHFVCDLFRGPPVMPGQADYRFFAYSRRAKLLRSGQHRGFVVVSH